MRIKTKSKLLQSHARLFILDGTAFASILGSFGNDNGDGNKNVNDYARAAHFSVHFLPSPHDYDVKFPQATFYNYGGGKNNKTNFSFSF